MNAHVVLEGPISAGKSTLAGKLQTVFRGQGIEAELLVEPVIEWQNFGRNRINMLERMYNKPKENSFLFQNVAAITKVEQLRNKTGFRIVERSLGAQKHVFLRQLLMDDKITGLENEIMRREIDILEQIPGMTPDLYVYMRVDPEISFTRIKSRGRMEEAHITLEYLQSLERFYDTWLLNMTEVPVLTLDTNNFFLLREERVAEDILRMINHL